jgi:2-polyprenyl-3-methyl-5-hydroxy-6-metoxy-1,4-benzoquinol methylase
VTRFSYQRLEKARIPCPLCASSDFETLCRHDRYWMGIETVACRSCDLIMTNPAPTEAAMGEFYRVHYRRVYNRVSRPTAGHIRKDELDRRAAYAADYLHQAGLVGPGRSVLDVGCAEGSLLKEIRRRLPGASLQGVEPGEGFADFARTHVPCDVYSSIEAAAGRGPFDCLIAIHVLEHISDPVGFLRSLRRHLSKSGGLYVDVPDATAYSSLDELHLAHLFHFTPKTLSETARAAGYVIAGMSRHQPPRHPASLRCVLKLEGREDPLPVSGGEDARARDVIASFDRSLLSYRVSRSFPIRAVKGVLRRLFSFASTPRLDDGPAA